MSRAGSSSERSYADVATCSATKYVNADALTTRRSNEGIRNSSSRRRMLPRWPKRLRSLSLIRCFPEITETTHGADAHACGLDLRAQPRNVDFDRVRAELRVVVGELLRDQLLGEHATGSRHEQLEQRPFADREIDRRAVAAHTLGFHVDREPADGHRTGGQRDPPQPPADPGLGPGDREGLGQIIITAQIESMDPGLDG